MFNREFWNEYTMKWQYNNSITLDTNLPGCNKVTSITIIFNVYSTGPIRFRAKSVIIGKKKNDNIIYYYSDIKNNKRNAKFMLIGEVQYLYLQSGVGNCGKDYGNGNKVKESDAK